MLGTMETEKSLRSIKIYIISHRFQVTYYLLILRLSLKGLRLNRHKNVDKMERTGAIKCYFGRDATFAKE